MVNRPGPGGQACQGQNQQQVKEAVRGKYAERYAEGTNLVLLADDVAEAFPNAEAVNEALRLVLRLSKIPAAKEKRPTAV